MPVVARCMALNEIVISSLDGGPLDLQQFEGKAVLIVNVASKCGLTPQYAGLEQIHNRYKARGFSVLGVPCNQFGGQEPGTPEEIASFCSTTYGVTFPLTEKVDVNGAGRHPLYAELTLTPDDEGEAGDVKWNFEKFLVGADGEVVTRFRQQVTPEAPELLSAIESALPA
jgi:glutathione peroxidase